MSNEFWGMTAFLITTIVFSVTTLIYARKLTQAQRYLRRLKGEVTMQTTQKIRKLQGGTAMRNKSFYQIITFFNGLFVFIFGVAIAFSGLNLPSLESIPQRLFIGIGMSVFGVVAWMPLLIDAINTLRKPMTT